MRVSSRKLKFCFCKAQSWEGFKKFEGNLKLFHLWKQLLSESFWSKGKLEKAFHEKRPICKKLSFSTKMTNYDLNLNFLWRFLWMCPKILQSKTIVINYFHYHFIFQARKYSFWLLLFMMLRIFQKLLTIQIPTSLQIFENIFYVVFFFLLLFSLLTHNRVLNEIF